MLFGISEQIISEHTKYYEVFIEEGAAFCSLKDMDLLLFGLRIWTWFIPVFYTWVLYLNGPSLSFCSGASSFFCVLFGVLY